ncbi:hypothetical protein BOX15_Mlig006920g3 [Macrostomum lignano]|uniref:Vitellogenin domain-containing protein n=2 Tax=Macrostomum lignano TaxID=282301 RepID=A0A1I8J1X4_9PLAT|nr:hypothetical protein BOX15_Mlig006920g2 [Macrostomum lignano]PAA78274.1 hypothetical protein BOX15_Mlig006920g3 [Macrostomum lignano]
MFAIKLLLLLILTTLLLPTETAAALTDSATPVHQVSVSISSTRSIVYHGMQVPMFQNAGNSSSESRRYFFPPLALLDCSSLLVINPDNSATVRAKDSEVSNTTERPFESGTMLRLSILLWTDEFLSAATDQLTPPPDARFDDAPAHVELMPLTELTLNWSAQAHHWLGEDFGQRFRLSYGWQDAQRPLARVNFTVSCKNLDDCRFLMAQLGDTDGSAGQIFDLKYRIRCNTQRRLSVTLASRHLLRSPLFTQLNWLALKSSGVVLASEAAIDQLAGELRRAALDELQEQQTGEQRADSINSEALGALLADAELLLRRSPVRGASLTQWADQVFWQPPHNSRGLTDSPTSGALRPDMLAKLFNMLFTAEVGGLPGHVRPASDSVTLLTRLADDGELPAGAVAPLREFLASYNRPGAEAIPVDAACELATSLGSAVSWNAASVRFVPSPNVQLYQLDTRRLLGAGTFAMRDVVLHYRVSEQRDHVVPLCRAVHGSADYTKLTWEAQAKIMRMRYLELLRRANSASTELQRMATVMASSRADTGPSSSVRYRSADDSSELYPGADAGSIDGLWSKLQSLSNTVNRSIDAVKSAWQSHFANSFCVLANSGPPPRGMSCRTISFVIPKKSLRKGRFLNRQVRVGTGTAGQNLFEPIGGDFYRFQLRGCCQ